jgi:3-deoxy-manno-octulosonate cytidylyltransferase (CMP-KDO synthetase)
VKVVTNAKGDALYFSRSPMPNTDKAKVKLPKAYKQVCIIPFARDYLDLYSATPPTYLEEIESVDMNRVLESGERIYCAEIEERSYPVDVVEDVARVEHWLQKDPLLKRYMR